MSKIVLFNGPSSCGKTSIIRAIKIVDQIVPWLSMGLDRLIEMMPHRLIGSDESARQGMFQERVSDSEGNARIVMHYGSLGLKMCKTQGQFIKTLADQENDVLVDDVLAGSWSEEVLKFYLQAWKEHTVYFIGVKCDLEELVNRELLRNDRKVGLAREQFYTVHKEPRNYDLMIDTTERSTFSAAKEVLAFIATNKTPQSFVRLRELA